MKKAHEIKETTNYHLFKFVSSNRELSNGLVKRLENSIQSFGYIKSRPIIVDKDMFIIDGQHRYTACKNLELPIYYCIEDIERDKAIVTLNTTQQIWRLQDYVHKYSSEYIEFYVELKKFMGRYNLGVSNSIVIVAGYRPTSSLIRYGKNFTINENADEVVSFLLEAKKYIDFWKTGKFVEAVVSVFKKCQKKHIKKLSDKIGIVKQQARVVDYLSLFENIINKGLSDDNKISLTVQ